MKIKIISSRSKNLNIILLCIIIGELILYGGVGWRWLENFYDEGGGGGENEGIFPLHREGWAFPKCSPGFVDLQF